MDTNTEAPVAPESNDAAALAREWAELMGTLIPPTVVEVEDIAGQKHRLRANLPAAIETRILRRLQGLTYPDLSGAADRIQSGQAKKDVRETIAGLIDGVAGMLGDEGMLEVISECFTLAHPKAVRTAIEAARGDEDTAQYLPEGRAPRASDVFSTADLVAGIVPFGMRAAARIGSTAASLLPPKI